MALEKKFSELPDAGTLTGDEKLVALQDGANKNIELNDVAAFVGNVSSGGVTWGAITSSATLSPASPNVSVNSTSGDIDITLPSPSSNVGTVYRIKNLAGANDVTIIGSIDGSTNYTMSALESITLSSNGTTYIIF